MTGMVGKRTFRGSQDRMTRSKEEFKYFNNEYEPSHCVLTEYQPLISVNYSTKEQRQFQKRITIGRKKLMLQLSWTSACSSNVKDCRNVKLILLSQMSTSPRPQDCFSFPK